MGVQRVKEPAFRVILADDDKEIRHYDPYIIARTNVEGSYDDSSSRGFRRLFRYISGHNSTAEDVAMTAPVVQKKVHRKIAMTAPVLQEQNDEAWEVAFVMPASFSMETTPRPMDERVVLEQIPGRTVAVFRFAGLVSDEVITENTARLTTWLDNKPFRVASRARSARYDPPFTQPFLRRNEIHITVELVTTN